MSVLSPVLFGGLQSFDPTSKNFELRFQLGDPICQCGHSGDCAFRIPDEEGTALLRHDEVLVTKLAKRVLNCLRCDSVRLSQLSDRGQASTRCVLARLDAVAQVIS